MSQPFTSVVPPVRHADSISIWTYEVARRLAKGAEPVIYSKRLHGRGSVEHDAGIEYRRLPSPEGKRLERWARRLRIAPPKSGENGFHYVYALAVALDVRRRGADLIHVHNFSQFVPVLRRLNPRARIVLHMHCEWLSQIDASRARQRIAAADRVFGCSQYIASLVARRFPEFAERTGVLYNGVDLEAFRAPANNATANDEARGPRALFVGRISPEKGIHDLLDAFERVLERVPRARLSVVGPPWTTPRKYIVDLSDDPHVRALTRFYEGESYLRKLERRMSPKLRAAVDFPGQVERQDLPRQYRTADVLVNPSLSESFGMSLIEAFASERPAIATRVGGMQELVRHGENGLLVAPADPAGLSDALVTLLADPELGRRFGRRGLADAERRFAWERIAEDVRLEYSALGKGV